MHIEESTFAQMCEGEWWLANGAGGWASSSVIGANTRKYHALLCASHPHSKIRNVLLSKFEEFCIVEGKRIPFSTNFYPGAIYPQGWKNLLSFSFDGAVARWAYEAEGARISKEVWCEKYSNITYARYTLLSGKAAGIEIFPFVNARDAHSIGLNKQIMNIREGMREITFSSPFAWKIEANRGMFRKNEDVYHNFQYLLEKEREEAFEEDLFCPGHFAALLGEGRNITLKIGESAAEKLEKGFENSGAINKKYLEPEKASARMELIVKKFKEHAGVADAKMQRLARAADAFIAKDGGQYYVVAGYPYFGEWGRDTMISLPGLCIYSGRINIAKNILRRWVSFLKNGHLPNRIENGEGIYESADGFLWMLWCIGELEREGGLDDAILREWWAGIKGALASWIGSNKFVEVEGDGLVSLKGERLTWMDAQIEGKAVTPRAGKRIEINALWCYGLNNCARWAKRMGDEKFSKKLLELAKKASSSMGKFYYAKEKYFYDAIEPFDKSFRPNQVWACALQGIGITKAQAKNAIENIEKKLVVGGEGLRTLQIDDKRYAERYCGNMRERDIAYHQGAIWPWLAGAYVQGALNAGVDAKHLHDALLEPFLNVRGGDAISVCEVYDDATHNGGGCPAQAWSVAEVLRAFALVEREMQGILPIVAAGNSKRREI
ncbi:hypothetical protein COU37_02735 [Candidatus Micrarchaeota archaeon CG10_big_fil_rev_8_21_14_0_10_45_29]|nr:MAG: hypothetical protein COU37_02735 [Candidatus Micrarchaeota archaeon CG10_big_fil_rev_8_21_14_0_10_45_29]